jgi:hypothetical protein
MAVWAHEDASKIPGDLIQLLHALCEIYRSTEEVSPQPALAESLANRSGY